MTVTEEGESSPVYRINKFEVRATGRDEFVSLLESTHAVIRVQQGFVRDVIMERKSDPDQVSFVALIELAEAGAIERVRLAIAQHDAAAGLDRQKVAARLGIKFASWVLAA
jgi:hypothetical protein